jgi:glycosyltransferase involved in cell wall biosynthesis
MRVLHVSTSLIGGAGIAARRLHESLLLQGIESDVLTLTSLTGQDQKFIQVLNRSFLTRIRSIVLTSFQKNVISKRGDYVTPLSLNLIGTSKVQGFNPDILHIHSTYNLLNEKFLENINRVKIPIVITLHDQRFFTGGCHYSGSCTNYESDCTKCPQVKKVFRPVIARSFLRMRNSIPENSNIVIVTPSKWLGQMSQDSLMFKTLRHEVIHNPIPAMSKLGIKAKTQNSRSIVGFIASDLNNPLKNLRNLLLALKNFDVPNTSIELHLAGSGDIDFSFEHITISQKIIRTERELVDFYSGLSCLVVPSFQDNSPNVIGEALMCGTKVIGANSGGIPELLDHDIDLIFDPDKPENIASVLAKNLIPYNKTELREVAVKTFGYSSIGESYQKLYESIVLIES